MALALDMNRGDLDVALERLLAYELVDFSPWRTGERDGVWQLMPVPDTPPAPRVD
jgi:hypothetical protein